MSFARVVSVATLLAFATACSDTSPSASAVRTSSSTVPAVDAPAASATTALPAYGGSPVGDTCRATQLAVRAGPDVSPATGQHPLSLVLVNESSSACHLNGYPTIGLSDAGGNALPFAYSRAGDQMVNSQPPANVNMPPGSAAFVLINKYRCDIGDKGVAGSVSVMPPGDTTSLSLPLDRTDLAYCGKDDPGSTVVVSAVAADFGGVVVH